MAGSAVLLMDLQTDFLAAEGAKMPVAALDARRRGYAVTVPVDAIGTNASWKRAFALWSMRRAGVALVPTLQEQTT